MPTQSEPFFDWTHLLNPNPGPPSAVYYVYAIFFFVVLVAGIYGNFVLRPRVAHKVRRSSAGLFSWIGIVLGVVGLIIVGLRFLGVPIISARIVTYSWLVITVLYIIFLVYFYFRMLPGRIRNYEKASTRLQYMPRPKGGKKTKRR